jgi:hypothetical protein
MPQLYNMGPTALLPSEGRRAEDFLNETLSQRFFVLGRSQLPKHKFIMRRHLAFFRGTRLTHNVTITAVVLQIQISVDWCI